MINFQGIFKALFCIILLSVAYILNGCGSSICKKNDSYIDTIIEIIEEGDIVFRRGEGIVSQVVLAHDIGGMYSHIGVVVSDKGKLKIAHSVPGEHDDANDFDRVKLDDISTFFSSNFASNGAVKRLLLDNEIKKIISSVALEKVAKKIPFDHHYNLEDTSELYCTEFVRHIYLNVGVDLSEGRRTSAYIPGMQGDYIMPSDIYNNDDLKLIYCF